MLIRLIIIQGLEPEDGDEVGVFNANDLCIGASVLTGAAPVGIGIWKDDDYTEEIDGYRDGDVFYFRYWDSSERVLIGLDSLNVFQPGRDNAGIISKNFAIHDLRMDNPLSVPTHFTLEQNYPNPFNSITEIAYLLAEPSSVRLEIYDVSGQSVAVIAEKTQPAGRYNIGWDSGGAPERGFPSGVYFYTLTATSTVSGAKFRSTRSMVLLK